MRRRVLEIVRTGPLATVQDLGRPGLAALGVGRSGAVDPASLRLANRLVGNPEPAAAVEVTYGGLVARLHGGAYVALAGAPCPMSVGGRAVAPYGPVWVPDGAELRLGIPTSGLRSYLAVRGGLEGVEPVLGSRATDTLAGLGPASLVEGDRIELGRASAPLPPVDLAPVAHPTSGEVVLRVEPGPRADWFSPAAHRSLLTTAYEVTAESDRVGMRLAGPTLERTREEELPSEGMVCGALQVPPTGRPTLFLADHPVTGGYPVIAVVVSADIGLAAQAVPGQRLRFTSVTTRGPARDH